ncbi:hypothetical protein MMC12_005774 [Toensbergia leucococca]|nr:hypothetical protein [Toensbergia leucococca]
MASPVASVHCVSLHTEKPLALAHASLLAQVKFTEKKTFPRNEALDFDIELYKRNTKLVIVLDDKDQHAAPPLAAYMVYTRSHRTILLHKLCVLEKYRRQGVARRLLKCLRRVSDEEGCESIQLWVDEARKPATCLYAAVGFEEKARVNNYYAQGRNGIKMTFDLR